MDNTRIHQLLMPHWGGEVFSFALDLQRGRCTQEEIDELLARGYIEKVSIGQHDVRYRLTPKGKSFFDKPIC